MLSSILSASPSFLSSPSSPPAATHLAVYCSFHGFFILLQHVAIQTPLSFGGRPSLYKIRILLYSTSCTSPRKLDSICFLQFRPRVLGLPLLHGTVTEAGTSPLPGQEGLVPTPLVPRSCFCTSLYSSPHGAPGSLDLTVIETVVTSPP